MKPRETKVLKRLYPVSLKPVMAAAVIIAILSAAFVYSVVQHHRTLPLTISYLQGRVYINGTKIQRNSRILENSFIRVTGNASMVLTFHNSLTIRIKGESLFSIHRSGINRKNSLMGYTFEIRKGTLFASITARGRTPTFCYLTPSVRIQSNKNDFMLKVGENSTTVIPREGVLQATALMTREEMELHPEKKYVITSFIESRDLSEQDEKNTEKIKNIGRHDDEGIDRSADLPQGKI